MFKLIIVCASLAVISCVHLDSREQIEMQMQHAEEMVQRRNDQIRENHEHDQEHRLLQQQQLDDFRREQDQKHRDDDQERRDRIHENRFDNSHQQRNQHNIPAYITFHPAIVHIPTRTFNPYDDSHYNFKYIVDDKNTGDVKSHQETRRGDQVQGEYRLMDSDGYQRIVNYRANDRDGFDAEVRREPTLTTLVQHHQQQQNYAGQHNQNRQSYTLHHQAQHPSFYTTQSFSRNDDGRINQHSTTTTSNNY